MVEEPKFQRLMKSEERSRKVKRNLYNLQSRVDRMQMDNDELEESNESTFTTGSQVYKIYTRILENLENSMIFR